MYKPESDLKNEIHIILRDFEIQTDHLISARRPGRVLINKKKRICNLVDFSVPMDHRVKIKEREKIDQYLYIVRELKSNGT